MCQPPILQSPHHRHSLHQRHRPTQQCPTRRRLLLQSQHQLCQGSKSGVWSRLLAQPKLPSRMRWTMHVA
ncbi:hypothetical protein PR202_ga04142 [Eleusine coracana subsp. coracana]|uniref:Uncharacterized protein n=1 Tax=Eleusine coracana subsp. coracana TaxID=191504 RepID=A0AAV5BQZ0_ELECO|nr:hypothetical protein PR202_ga04142 [Eleusine coracana subsp. coracana]